MSDPMALREGVGESSSQGARNNTFNGLKEMLNAHYDRFPSSYGSVDFLPQDVLVHMRILERAKESHMLEHEIWVDQEAFNLYKLVFASIYEIGLQSKLSSIISAYEGKICKSSTFSTSDNYSLDVFLVEGWHGKNIEELLNWVKSALYVTEEAKLDIELDLLAIGEIVSPEHTNIYQGTYKGQKIVMKELQIDNRSFVATNFWKGMKILCGLRHSNVLLCLGANTDTTGTLKIVTEYMSGGNLFDYLQRNQEVLTLSQKLMLAINVAEGIKHLIGQMVIHQNINCSNILMDENNVAKVDLPSSKYMAWAGKNIIPQVTSLIHAFDAPEMKTPKIRRWCKYTAPEAMNRGDYGDRSDVYSFGMVLWTILTATLPYENWDNITPRHTAVRVIEGARPELPIDTNPKLKKIIEECWDSDPMFRPHISEARAGLVSLLSEINQPTLTTSATPTTSASPTTYTSPLVLRNKFDSLADLE